MEWNEGDVVRKLRDAFGLTLEQLAMMSGASLTAINRLETGRTQEAKRPTLAKIAKVFSLTGPQLFELRLKLPPIDAALSVPIPERAKTKVRQRLPEGRRLAKQSQHRQSRRPA